MVQTVAERKIKAKNASVHIQQIEANIKELFKKVKRIFSKKQYENSGINILGQQFLAETSESNTLVSYLIKAAAKFSSAIKNQDSKTERQIIQDVQTQLIHEWLSNLQTTQEPQFYFEAALFLVLIDKDAAQKVSAIIFTDIGSNNSIRRNWALQVLKENFFQNEIAFTSEQFAMLTNLLDSTFHEASSAFHILASVNVLQEVLVWCWKILRGSDRFMAEIVRDRLEYALINGTVAHLRLLDEGLRDKSTHQITVELLRNIRWIKGETLPYALKWLIDENTEVRHLATILLSNQSDLYNETQSVILKAVKEQIDTDSASLPEEVRKKWSDLFDEPQQRRLYEGMKSQGWEIFFNEYELTHF